jgi:hypothetical protein
MELVSYKGIISFQEIITCKNVFRAFSRLAEGSSSRRQEALNLRTSGYKEPNGQL